MFIGGIVNFERVNNSFEIERGQGLANGGGGACEQGEQQKEQKGGML